ncbi:MAG: hypothetical protein LBL52_01755 [Rickettsiales bacterium]|jgi:hypothetical protein|nr:hypothetical protein [Rickettsiales bacterium]
MKKLLAMVMLMAMPAGAANYYSCSACAVPGACQSGATQDCRYNAVLTLEEATAAIGTPEKSRWQVVAQTSSPGNGISASADNLYAPGVYRIDAYVAGNSYSSNIVVLNQPASVRIYSLLNAGGCLNNACTDLVFFKSPYMGSAENVLVYGAQMYANNPNGGRMATPGLTLSDMDRTSGMVYLYKLN